MLKDDIARTYSEWVDTYYVPYSDDQWKLHKMYQPIAYTNSLKFAELVINLIQSHAKEQGWSKPVIKNVMVGDMTILREDFAPLTDEDFK